MFIVNGLKATLYQFNRTADDNPFDDQNYKTITIKCCPYDISQGIRYGIYTVAEAKGYYQVPRYVDVREGDQIVFTGKDGDQIKHTILNVQDNWLFNRVENKVLAIK